MLYLNQMVELQKIYPFEQQLKFQQLMNEADFLLKHIHKKHL
jgi:hypothetical protein